MLLQYLILYGVVLSANGQGQSADEGNIEPQEEIQVSPGQENAQPQEAIGVAGNQDNVQGIEQLPLVQEDEQTNGEPNGPEVTSEQIQGAIGIRQCASGLADLCYTINDNGDDYLITIEHPKRDMYAALGFGEGMFDADIFVGCADFEGRVAVGHRKSISHVAPKLVSTNPENNPTILSTRLVGEGFVIDFSVQKGVIKNHETKLMWSFGNYPEPCDVEAKIRYHEDRGFLDLPLTANN